MIDKYKTHFNKFIFILFAFYFISSLLQYYQHIFHQRSYFDPINRSFFFFLIKEFIYLFFFIFSIFYIRSKKIRYYIFFITIYIIFLLILNILNNNNILFLLSGLRVIEIYFACLFIYYFASKNFSAVYNFINIVFKIIVFFSIVLVLYELFFFIPDSNIFTSVRTAAFFNLPNLFSIFLASIAIYYATIYNGKKKYLYLCILLFLSLTTGGRAGISLILILFFFSIFNHLRINKLFLFILLFTLLPLIFKILSLPIISGRTDTAGLLTDGRIDHLKDIMLYLSNSVPLLDIFFGKIGTGTLAAIHLCNDFAIECYDSPLKQPHNAFITLFLSFGLFGLLIIGVPLILEFINLMKKDLSIFFVIIILASFQSLLELHPIIFIIPIMFGLIKSKQYKL